MNEEQKNKYNYLKEKNRERNIENYWKNDILFKECLEALKEYKVLTLEESKKILNTFQEKIPINISGSIDWKKFNGIVKEDEFSYIKETLNYNDNYYLLWDREEIPCIICNLCNILKNLEDVLAVSFNTWIFSMNEKEVIEFHHEGMVVYGKLHL